MRLNKQESSHIAAPEGPFPGAITRGQKSMLPWYRLITCKESQEKKPGRMTRQMVLGLNPDNLAVSFQVFESVLRQ